MAIVLSQFCAEIPIDSLHSVKTSETVFLYIFNIVFPTSLSSLFLSIKHHMLRANFPQGMENLTKGTPALECKVFFVAKLWPAVAIHKSFLLGLIFQPPLE